ncbi:MAG: hypothetical protein K2N89_01080 [Lachnospiraceae bacterium]|nr:hypothetical protein [Lachnospiraceae bacterium]
MRRLKLNNKGAALITVLVITTFITILATTMLYVAATNFQQKQTDYQNKQSFYKAEKALDELKSILVKDVQTAYVEAYNKTTRNFLSKTAAEREAYFQDIFMDTLKKTWEKRVTDSGDLLGAVQSMMTGEYAAEAASFYKVSDYGVYENDTHTLQKFALRGVQVKYTEGNYTTFLYTDICLEPPVVDWSAESFSTSTDLVDREKIAFTDYVSYVNWRKADYDDSNDGVYDGIGIW